MTTTSSGGKDGPHTTLLNATKVQTNQRPPAERDGCEGTFTRTYRTTRRPGEPNTKMQRTQMRAQWRGRNRAKMKSQPRTTMQAQRRGRNPRKRRTELTAGTDADDYHPSPTTTCRAQQGEGRNVNTARGVVPHATCQTTRRRNKPHTDMSNDTKDPTPRCRTIRRCVEPHVNEWNNTNAQGTPR